MSRQKSKNFINLIFTCFLVYSKHAMRDLAKVCVGEKNPDEINPRYIIYGYYWFFKAALKRK